MKRVIAAVCFVDLTLLLWMVKVRLFCVEWLSCPARRFERGIIVAYCVCSILLLSPAHSFAFLSAMLVCDAFVCAGMWFEHCRSAQWRLYKCFDFTWILLRTFLVGLAILFSLNVLLTPPHLWTDVPIALQTFLYAALHYSTSLPEDGGKRGRRRKLAAAKLKELLGGWMPVPARTPA